MAWWNTLHKYLDGRAFYHFPVDNIIHQCRAIHRERIHGERDDSVCPIEYAHGFVRVSWWPHPMETFSAIRAICVGNSPVTDEFPAQRPVMRSFDVFFHLRLNKPLSEQWWGWWVETLSRPSWRHCYVFLDYIMILEITYTNMDKL